MSAREDDRRAGATPCPPAKAKRKKIRSRNLGDAKKTNGKRDPDNRDNLGEGSAQIPIRATLIGSNCCEALGITERGYAPVLDLCRALVAAGHDPRRPLHAHRGNALALIIRSIGDAAQLRIATHGVGFERIPGCTGSPPVRQSGPTIARPGSDDPRVRAATRKERISGVNTGRRR
jgi:hypothetical protein